MIKNRAPQNTPKLKYSKINLFLVMSCFFAGKTQSYHLPHQSANVISWMGSTKGIKFQSSMATQQFKGWHKNFSTSLTLLEKPLLVWKYKWSKVNWKGIIMFYTTHEQNWTFLLKKLSQEDKQKQTNYWSLFTVVSNLLTSCFHRKLTILLVSYRYTST